MQEIFFTILVIWALFRIFGERKVIFKSTSWNSSQRPDQNPPDQYIKEPTKTSVPKQKPDLGEYIDYEEIK